MTDRLPSVLDDAPTGDGSAGDAWTADAAGADIPAADASAAGALTGDTTTADPQAMVADSNESDDADAVDPTAESDAGRSGVTVELDQVALDLARAAAIEEAGSADAVGPALDAVADDAVAVTARFAVTDRGYRGWFWSVTLAVLDAAHPTVSEVVLLPGPEALLAPSWVPWEQRIRSGDLGVGDLLPSAPDDFRLVPGYLQSPDPAVEEVALEVGLGRVRVMGRDGLIDAAERWHDGPFGPDDEMSTHAPAHCLTCGFYLPLQGSLGVLFGACGNEYSPADGRVVDAGYGCGAHSEALTGVSLGPVVGETVVDELRLEVHDHPARPDVDLVDDPVIDAVDDAVGPEEMVEIDVEVATGDRADQPDGNGAVDTAGATTEPDASAE